MSATFLLVHFVCLKESTWERRKNAFYFTSKSPLVLEIIKFKHFRYSNIMTSNAQAWNTKHILLKNLGSKCSLVMKFGQFMQYYKMIFLIKKLYEKHGLAFFNFQKTLCKKDSVKVSMLIWTNFDRFAITYLI